MYRFTFDLLPKKSKEVIKKEEKRENTSLLIAFLPLIAVVLSLGLIFYNNFVVKRDVSQWEQNVQESENSILGYSFILSAHEEFITKTNLLEEPVILDVSPQVFFDIAEELSLVVEFPIEIGRYGRQSDGSFDLTISFQERDQAGEVLRVFEQIDTVERSNALSLTTSSSAATDGYSILLNFFIVNDEENGNT